MKDKPLNLHIRLGSHKFDAPFANNEDSLLRNDRSLLFEQLPEAIAKELYKEIKESRNVNYPLSVQGEKFTLKTNIRITTLGYRASEDRHYFVVEPEPISDS